MATKIEWTDETWNPSTGCRQLSDGCDNCYAKRITERFNGLGSFETVHLHPERLDAPLRWRKPRRVFVDSMSDLFHEAVPDEFIARVFAVMAATPQHTYQILTKRHGRMRALLNGAAFKRDVHETWLGLWNGGPAEIGWPLSNVWLGMSVEDQRWAGIRIPTLLETPAAVRFLSCEPLLGPVDLGRYLRPQRCSQCGRGWSESACGPTHAVLAADPGLHWVIVGGESGPGARPMHPKWACDLRDQCVAAGVPVFVKQLGSVWARENHSRDAKGGDWSCWPEDLRVREFPQSSPVGALL